MPTATKRTSAALVTAALVTLLAAVTGDGFWADTWPGAERNRLVLRVLLFLITAGLVAAALRSTPWRSRRGVLAFAGWAALLGFWFVGQWPGLVEPDTLDLVGRVRDGSIYDWYSVSYAALTGMAFDLVPQVWFLGLLQLTLFAGVLAYATTVVLDRTRSGVAVLVALGALGAPLAVAAMHYSRDPLFAALLLLLALLVAEQVTRGALPSRPRLVALAGLAALLAALRTDGLVVALLTPVILAIALRPARRELAVGASAFAVALLLLLVALPSAFSVESRPRDYALTLRMNPLGAALQAHPELTARNDPDGVFARLSRVIDVERVRALQTPVNIEAYWQGAWNPQASDEDWEAFTSAANELLLASPGAVVENRLRVLRASSSLAGGSFTATEYLNAGWRERVRTVNPTAPAPLLDALTAEPPILRLYTAQRRLLQEAGRFDGLAPRGAALSFNLLPWFLALAVGLAGVRRWRFEGVVALLVLSRVPVVVAAAPIAQFKYYDGVFLGGLVVTALLLGRALDRLRL